MRKLANRKLALVLGFALMASMTHPASAEPTNKQLTIGVTQEFANLNYMVNSLSATSYVQQLVVHPLVSMDEDWRWKCYLCTDLPTIENGMAKIIDGEDGKKLEVKWELKKEAKWGDGTPVTGHDVKLSWEVGSDPAVSTPEKETYQKIESITVDEKDPKKFTMVFKKARYDYYQLGTFVVLPSHLEADVYKKSKGQTGAYEKQTKYNTDSLNPGLYNGPYLVKEIKLSSHVIVERNPQYYGKAPAIDKIIIKLIPNTQTLEANLLSGTIDMISELGMTFDQALAFEKRLAADKSMAEKFSVLFEDSMIYEHIDLNLRNPILSDIKVRQALSYAIDRDKLTQALFDGRQKPAISNIHPRDIYYTENVTKYPYDQKKAAALLDEAGWKLKNGVRQKDGKTLEFTLMTTAQDKTRELVQVYLQQEWKKAGIKINIKNEPARVFFGETVRKAGYTGMALYAWISSPDNPPRSTLSSLEIPTSANGHSGQNSGGWRNSVADEIFEKIYTEFDTEKRKEMMTKLQQEYTQEVPVLPLYWRAGIAIVPTNLKGFKLTGHQFQSTLNADRWELTGGEASKSGH